MTYRIEYGRLFDPKTLEKLSRHDLLRIQAAIEEKLATQPEMFGKPLRRSLRGYRSLRVGDYRIVFRVHASTVIIFAIEHRSVIYREFEKRVLGIERH